MAISYVLNALPLTPNTNAYPLLFPLQNPTSFFFCQDYPTPLAVLERKPNVFWVQPTLILRLGISTTQDIGTYSPNFGTDTLTPGTIAYRQARSVSLVNALANSGIFSTAFLKALLQNIKEDAMNLADNMVAGYTMPNDSDPANNIELGKHILKCLFSIAINYDSTTIYGANPLIPFDKFTTTLAAANLIENNFPEFADPNSLLYGAIGRKRVALYLLIVANLVNDIQYFQEQRSLNWVNITSTERGVAAIKTIFDELSNYF